MTTGVPTKFLTGRIFLPEDNLGIGQGVWDHSDPVRHKFGVGSGEVGPRWYPSLDNTGNMFLNYGTLIKSEYDGYGDHGFGFEGNDFVVKMQGIVVLRLNTLGAQLAGALTQTAADPEFLPSHSGLSQLLFPLFTDKTLIAQFNRPAVAGVDKNNDFRAYRDIPTFLTEFNSLFTRGGSLDVGFVKTVNNKGNFQSVLGNQPRITYGHVSKKCLGLLIEPTTTNLITQTFNLTNWDTTTGITLTKEDNAVWASKGLNKPFFFTESNANTEHSITKNFSADVTQPISFSFFFQARAFTGTRRFLAFVSNADRSQSFGIILDATSNGAPLYNSNRLVGNGAVTNYVIENVGNGLYRIRMSGIINSLGTAGSSSLRFTLASLGDTPGNANLVFTPGTNTGNWCLLNDAQVEQNPYTTSYIQSADMSMVRNADILSLNLANFRYSSIEGFFELKFRSTKDVPVNAVVFSLRDDAGTTRLDYYVAAIDVTANTFTIGTKQYQPSVSTVVNANFATVNISKAVLNISYSNILSGFTKAVVSGESGFRATVSYMSYE